jgi:hypothetical protein
MKDANAPKHKAGVTFLGVALACVALVTYTLADALHQDGDGRGVDDTVADVCTITFYVEYGQGRRMFLSRVPTGRVHHVLETAASVA